MSMAIKQFPKSDFGCKLRSIGSVLNRSVLHPLWHSGAVIIVLMKTTLEFGDSLGSESIADQIEEYDGPLPAIGDTVYLDIAARFRVAQRVFYYIPESPGTLYNFRREVKVSLHCERL